MDLTDTQRIQITFYLRRTLGIQYVNLDRLERHGDVLVFDGHRFRLEAG